MKPLEKLARNNTLDCLWPYLLRILSDRPAHAYVLREEVSRRYGFRPGTVTAYRVLYSLRKEGMVEETEKGRKRVYRITRKGRHALRQCAEFYRERARMLS